MRTLMLILLSSFIIGCGGSDDDTPQNKGLYSYWSNDSGAFLDLRSLDNTTRQTTFSNFLPDGSQCFCSLTLAGGEVQGSYVMNNCTHQDINTLVADCSAINQTGSYSVENNQLIINSPIDGVQVYD